MFELLTMSNPKTLKGQKQGYQTWIMHLLPSDLSGLGNVCPKASDGCRAACLNTAGRGGMFKPGGTNSIQEARRRRTQLYWNDPQQFMTLLVNDIERAARYSLKKNMEPVFRLNGTSDILWERTNIINQFPMFQFYDYTKIIKRKNIPRNYHLTFSRSEANICDVKTAIENDMNVAVVFDQLPETWMGLPVINGDDSDLRFLDPKNVIVGLKAKGRARRDSLGFVVKSG